MLDSLYPKYYLDIPNGEDYGGGDEDAPDDIEVEYEAPQTDMGDIELSDIVVTPPITSSTIGGTTTTPKYKIIEPGGIHTISLIRGDFNPLKSTAETREYTIIGDVGSKFTLTISSEDHEICEEPLEITDPSGYVAKIVFPYIYEYTTYSFSLRAGPQTALGAGLPKFEFATDIPQYVDPTITLSFFTDDPYTTNCAYSGGDATFTAEPFIEPTIYHDLNNKTYGKLTHTVVATITTGYLYIIKAPNISDYLLLDDRTPLSTADFDKTLELGDDETRKSGTIAAAESTSKKVITLTSTVQIDKVGKEDTVYELDIDSIITNIPQALGQEVSTPRETAITIDVLKGINISTYLTPAIVLPPKHGVLVTSSFEAGVGTCIYTPNNLFQGEDEFIFEVTDGTNASVDLTVSISVGNTACGYLV